MRPGRARARHGMRGPAVPRRREARVPVRERRADGGKSKIRAWIGDADNQWEPLGGFQGYICGPADDLSERCCGGASPPPIVDSW
jgi:hypothetical protein